MNPAAEGAAAPPQPHRPSTSCPRHPEEAFTGFCPSCLCERLSVLDQSAAASGGGPSSRKPPSSAAAIKALFKSSGGGNGSNHRGRPANGSFFPELRRTKSFSAAKNEGFSGVFEPQRRSCDVRGRSTLYSLFHQDDGGRGTASFCNRDPSSSSIPAGPEPETAANRPEPEIEPEPHRIEEEAEIEIDHPNQNQEDCEIRAFEIEEEQPEPESQQEQEEQENRFTKPMKEYIDLDSQTKKPRDLKELVGSFWTRLQKWRSKQKTLKKNRRHHHGGGSATLPVEKPIGRQFRETQSEIADYGFGRRSCDTDPRFSLDAGRISFDDPRYSFDEPRPSWDGYLISRSSLPRMPTMLSVVEDAPRPDAQIPVEESPVADEPVPGGSAQTRDYYSDASRRRRSFERSTSIRKTAAAVVAEIDELKPPSSISNAKVSPATIDNRENRDPRDSNSNPNSLRDDCSETHEIGDRRGPAAAAKKSRRWGKAWSIWGLIHRRGGPNRDDEDDDRCVRPNGVARSLSESWPELRAHGAEAGQAFHRRVFRSNSSVSWRNSSANLDRSFGSSTRINDAAAGGNGGNGNNGNAKLDRNRSSNSVENGLLRFYLTPGGRRTGSSSHAQSITRSVMRLY